MTNVRDFGLTFVYASIPIPMLDKWDDVMDAFPMQIDVSSTKIIIIINYSKICNYGGYTERKVHFDFPSKINRLNKEHTTTYFGNCFISIHFIYPLLRVEGIYQLLRPNMQHPTPHGFSNKRFYFGIIIKRMVCH